MKTIKQRFSASLLITPGILLLLVWIGVFAGEATVMKMGLTYFLLSAVVASIVIAYCATLYLDFVINRSK